MTDHTLWIGLDDDGRLVFENEDAEEIVASLRKLARRWDLLSEDSTDLDLVEDAPHAAGVNVTAFRRAFSRR
jgi:hypothetical protein